MTKYAQRASKIRAFPAWGIPVEALLLVLLPERNVKNAKVGLGANQNHQCQQMQEMMKDIMHHVRRWGYMPIETYRAKSCPSD